MSAINFNPEGVLINNETVINAPYNEDFELSHNLFSSVDFQIKVGDTVLTPQTDYILTNRYERAATEMGLYNIYQRVRILNNAYSGSTLSIRYRAVGDFVDADKITATKTSAAITFSNSGNGADSGSTFDGSAARTLSYNSIGAAASNHSHKMFEFTYVVDSDQKLEDWANNVADNDYTSVLIKKGTWTYSASSGINLTTTGTKVIVGETGSKIIINKTSSGTGTGISYDALPTTNDCFVFNLTLEYNATSGRALLRCINLTNCQIVANGDSTSVNITGLEGCVNILRCDAKAYQSDVGNYSAGYRNCSNIRESSGYGEALTRGTGFYGCNSVQFCTDTSTTPYYDTYSSPTDDATYACVNTLEGGWNTTA